MHNTFIITYTTYFNSAKVDRVIGGAYKSLEADFESRREHMDADTVRACEARLASLRATWMLLLERLP